MLLLNALLVNFLFIVKADWSSSSDGCQTPDKQLGICLPLSTCRTISEYMATLPRPIPKNIRAKLRAYQCGVLNYKPKVCCPPKTVNFDEPPEEPSIDSFQFPDVSRHRNIGLIPRNCGHLDTVMKIVNGNKTSLFEFPWMALLSYATTKGISFRCGGTIINEKYILTAAHCVTNLQKSREILSLLGVRVGEHDLTTVKDCEKDDDDEEEVCASPVQDLSIEEIVPHEDYNTKTHTDDIALLRVSKIDLSQENSRPVCLPFDNTGNFNYINRRVVVTGWGFTETGRPSQVLLKAEMSVSSLHECQEKYKKVYKFDQKQLCAGGSDRSDSCGGDSGGPLHSLEALHGEPRYVQQGVVSFGPADCGNVPLPGVYTRVASYMGWILDNIRP